MKLPKLPKIPFPKQKLINSFLKIEKRIRFVISTLILVFLVLFSTFFQFNAAWFFIPVFALAVYGLTYFSIIEEIEKSEWLTLFILPVLFTVGFYLFYFLFPIRWLTRVPFIVLYGVSIYAIMLTSNIFNVGVEKSLQLYRAAFSVNYFYQTLMVFLISNIIFFLRQTFFLGGFTAGIVIFPLALQLYWSVKLNPTLDRDLVRYSLFTSLIMTEVAILASFVPLRPTIAALFVTVTYYSLTGLITAFLDNRLFKNTIREYVFVWAFVFIIVLLTLNW